MQADEIASPSSAITLWIVKQLSVSCRLLTTSGITRVLDQILIRSNSGRSAHPYMHMTTTDSLGRSPVVFVFVFGWRNVYI